MPAIALPPAVEAVITEFRTCELTTIAKDDTPITWPVTILYKRDDQRFYAATSAGLPVKAYNIRRNARVSLLFSEPIGSGLDNPPAVLVQGRATAPDEVITQVYQSDDLLALGQIIARRQRSDFAMPKFLTHMLLDWYYIRLPIYIDIERVLWWPDMDFAQEPQRLERSDVV